MSKKQMANRTKMTAEMLFDSLIWLDIGILAIDEWKELVRRKFLLDK